MSIYKSCDIRGRAAGELTPELYRSWGRVLGSWAPPLAKFVAGGDVRGSTPEFLAALVDGLAAAGVDCIDLGQLPTPMIYYARRRLNAAGCAVVTASHNAAAINGLKWMVGQQPPGPEEVERLRLESERPAGRDAERPPTEPRTLDISFDYVAWLQEMWIESLRTRLHVVLDPMHGCWAARARRYLNAIFPECLLLGIHDWRDPEFDGLSPDCSHADHLHELCEAVYRHRADMGIAFDGDGDRIALVDNEGMALTAEEATWVLLDSFGAELQGQRFVHDLKFSDRIPEAAAALGAEPLAERSGHAFLRARMRQTDARFGAEVSGHYFFRELEGGDDGLLAACRVIAHLGQCGQTLAQLRRGCPAVFITPDLRLALDAQSQKRVIQQVRQAWADHPQSTLDGVRIDVPGGWALVRSSVTEPALTFRFESADWHGLEHLVGQFCGSLAEVGPQLWTCYKAAMGTHDVATEAAS